MVAAGRPYAWQQTNSVSSLDCLTSVIFISFIINYTYWLGKNHAKFGATSKNEQKARGTSKV